MHRVSVMKNWALFQRVVLLGGLAVGGTLASFESVLILPLSRGEVWSASVLWSLGITLLALMVSVPSVLGLAERYFGLNAYLRHHYPASLCALLGRLFAILGSGGLGVVVGLYGLDAIGVHVNTREMGNLVAAAVVVGGICDEVFLKGVWHRVGQTVRESTRIEDVLAQDGLAVMVLTMLACAAVGFLTATLVHWV